MPPKNGPIHVECSIMSTFMASATEAEVDGLFQNCQKYTSMKTPLHKMSYLQPTTPVAKENSAEISIVNRISKQKIYRAIGMIFYLVHDKVRQNRFHLFWEAGKNVLADYFTKHHSIWHRREMHLIILKPTMIYIENSKYRINGTMRGCSETSNPGVT